MGTKAGETSPLARVRRYNDALALRLLIDLYRDQNLRDDGGITRKSSSTEIHANLGRGAGNLQGLGLHARQTSHVVGRDN